jgi:hypothetical protein
MVEDTKSITRNHLQKWKQWSVIKLDELESEALFWLATHADKCEQMFAQRGRRGYLNWMGSALTNLLNRYCQDQLVRARTFTPLSIGDIDSNVSYGHTQDLTYWQVKTALKARDADMLKLAKEYCTDKQYQAIESVLFEGLKPSEMTESMGNISSSGVLFHIDRGIANIVSKASNANKW